MRIVTYNVNGLRARVQQHRSLNAFLDALDADIICVQETKLRRQELSTEVAVAEGYESFFSFTRTSQRGRAGYSGVATFCRVGAPGGPLSSDVGVVLPAAADEGITGLLHIAKGGELDAPAFRVGAYEGVWAMEAEAGGPTRAELLHLDSEGRCVVTDHNAFVLFNIYGPNVDPDDEARMRFKLRFYSVLQRRCEGLLKEGRRVLVAGDLNISPAPIDSCHTHPSFALNPCRIWLSGLLRAGGGPFADTFRHLHPHREGAFTCWSQASGAEEFNYGSRIDLILAAGPCVHDPCFRMRSAPLPTLPLTACCAGQLQGEAKGECKTHRHGVSEASASVGGRGLGGGGGSAWHGFVECEVKAADVMTDFKRFKADSLPREFVAEAAAAAASYLTGLSA